MFQTTNQSFIDILIGLGFFNMRYTLQTGNFLFRKNKKKHQWFETAVNLWHGNTKFNYAY